MSDAIKADALFAPAEMFGGAQAETISIPVRFYRSNIYVIRRGREASVPRRLQIPLRHYAEIQWNPVSFRFIRGTLRTSLRSICSEAAVSPSVQLILFRYPGMCVSVSLIFRIITPTTNVSGIVHIPTEFPRGCTLAV